MIAKSILAAVLIACSISANSKSPYETNYYSILKEYDIHPPALKYGYPLWYQYDSLPVTGIIYLKDDLTDLHKINDITYVAEPTIENAQIIRNFSGKIGEYPKFYIIPDSTLEWRKVIEFLEFLTFDYWQTNFLFCGGSNGSYFNFTFINESCWWGRPLGCYSGRNLLLVMNNCFGDIFVEGEFMNSDSVFREIQQFYWGNYEIYRSGERYYYDDNYEAMVRSLIDSSYCLDLIKSCNDQMVKLGHKNTNNAQLYEPYLNELTTLLNRTRKWGSLLLPREDAQIQFKFQNCERYITEVYSFVDKINKGVYLSREKKAHDLSTLSYMDLVKQKNVEYLEYIHLEFPDLILYGIGSDPPPPPPELPLHY